MTPHSAIRKGDYKLIFDWYGKLELYNIKKDLSEKNNLAFKKPKRTKKLFSELVDWLEINVNQKYWPKPNLEYDSMHEVRKVPHVNLYKVYKQDKNIMDLAH